MLPVRIGGFPSPPAFGLVGKHDLERRDGFVIALKPAIHRKTELAGSTECRAMHRQAVKEDSISCIDPTACPISSLGLFRLDVSLGVLKPRKMRCFLDLERPLSLQTIMERHPYCVALRASRNPRVVLMRMQKGALAVGEDHPCNGLGMNQKTRPHKSLHHIGQYRMMRQRVELLQAERAICGLLIFRIRIGARHGGIRDAVRWCGPLDRPALVRCNADHIAEELLQVPFRHQVSDEDVSVSLHLTLERYGIQISGEDRAKWFHPTPSSKIFNAA